MVKKGFIINCYNHNDDPFVYYYKKTNIFVPKLTKSVSYLEYTYTTIFTDKTLLERIYEIFKR